MTDEDPPGEKLTRQGAAAYQGALEAVLAILIAVGIGYWADQHYGTAPRWIIVGTLIGFGSFVLRLFRMRRLFEAGPEGGRGTKRDPDHDARR